MKRINKLAIATLLSGIVIITALEASAKKTLTQADCDAQAEKAQQSGSGEKCVGTLNTTANTCTVSCTNTKAK